MKCALLIYTEEREEQRLSQDEWQAVLRKHREFATKHLQIVLAGEAFESVHTAKALRQHGGRLAVSAGPSVETKQQLGGFYLIETDSLDQALEVARDLPIGSNTSIEVRPVMDL